MNFTAKYRLLAELVLTIWGGLMAFANPAFAQQTVPFEIVGVGDSLMAGYELPADKGFTAQLEAALISKGYAVKLTNAGVSGDTSSGGLERLDWSVPDTTRLVILEFGGNDALRGITPDITRNNIEAMVVRLKERKIAVVLAGMLAPPNLGKDYEAAFNPIWPDLATKHQVPLIPFFLNGVAGQPSLQLSDAMHPNEAGVKAMVENAMPVIEPEIKRLMAGQ